MNFIGNSCRVCLTTEEDVKFKPINFEIAKKISTMYKLPPISLQSEAPVIICKQCDNNVNTAWNVFNRVQDAGDYFEFYAKQKDAEKSSSGKVKDTRAPKPVKKNLPGVIYECDACKVAFNDMQSLNDHMASHNAFACFFCKSIFASANERQAHLHLVHHEKTKQLLKLTVKTTQKKSVAAMRPRKFSI